MCVCVCVCVCVHMDVHTHAHVCVLFEICFELKLSMLFHIQSINMIYEYCHASVIL